MDLGGSLHRADGRRFGVLRSDRSSGSRCRRPGPPTARTRGPARRAAPPRRAVGYTADGMPVEFARDRFRPDRTRVVLESTRGGGVRSSARAVVIGGGVGGCSILYWLSPARLGRCRARRAGRPDERLDVPFRGTRRPAAQLARADADDDELGRALPHARGDEVGLETGWREVGSLRLASSPERMEEITRQAGWAKTFGLPLELVSADEAQRLFPPMSTDGVLGAAYLPSDGYIDPSQLTFALAEGARRRGAEINTNTRVTGDPRRARRGDRRRDRQGRDRDRHRGQRRRHVRARDRRARRRHRADHPDGARVSRPGAVRPAARHADDARSVAARLLPRRSRAA